MVRTCLWLLLSAWLCLGWTLPVWAVELDAATRTVPLNDKGDVVTLSLQEVQRGKRLFNAKCATCHAGGITKTNPVVGLDPESLALATPPRNNLEALVDYLKNPTSYDGLTSIAEVHPSLASADLYPKMRDLTEDDLYAIAGHILIQPKVRGVKWGGGKVHY
ncbi:photosystem II cytochrome c-550 [Gloeomargarita sp.]